MTRRRQRQADAVAALKVSHEGLALGNERFEAEGGTFVRNRSTPGIQNANQVTDVTASTLGEIDRLLRRVEEEFDGFSYYQFDLGFTTPAAFEARLMLDGYSISQNLVMQLEGDPTGPVTHHDIRQVVEQDDWKALDTLNELDWREDARKNGKEYAADMAREWSHQRHIQSPPIKYWMGYVDGEPRAYCSSWTGVDGIGEVEDVFTHPEFRHRGLATALIHHGVADLRAQGVGPVIISADPDDSPKQMYAALGFRPLVVSREYLKEVAP